MEQLDPESIAALLQKRPLPWKKVPLQLRPGESTIEDATGRPVMRVTSNLAYHQLLLDLICHTVPAHLASLEAPVMDKQQAEHFLREAWLAASEGRRYEPSSTSEPPVRTVPQMEAEIAAIQGEIGAAIGESMKEFGMTVPEPFGSPTKEH